MARSDSWDERLQCGRARLWHQAFRRELEGFEVPQLLAGDECGALRLEVELLHELRDPLRLEVLPSDGADDLADALIRHVWRLGELDDEAPANFIFLLLRQKWFSSAMHCYCLIRCYVRMLSFRCRYGKEYLVGKVVENQKFLKEKKLICGKLSDADIFFFWN